MIVHRQTNDSVCVNLTTLVPDIGVVTTIKICFQAMTDDTRVTCIGTVSFQKGKYPIPKGTAEKSAYERRQAFYSTLFPASSQNVNNTVATPLPKAEQPQPRVITEMIEQFVRSIPTEYMVYFILFLGLMFLFNTLILWNLVYAMERQHQQIMLLKKALE
jgi:hypothetical protein